MTKMPDQRPPVAIGHVRFAARDVAAAARWFEAAGLRPIVTREDFAVFELRGGTHLVLRQAGRAPRPGAEAPFDLMVDDIDAAHRNYAAKGFDPSAISRGRIHDSFQMEGPDGSRFTVVSSHAGDRPV